MPLLRSWALTKFVSRTFTIRRLCPFTEGDTTAHSDNKPVSSEKLTTMAKIYAICALLFSGYLREINGLRNVDLLDGGIGQC